MPAEPQYVAAGSDGAVYFGFGANGGGSNLYRYFNGSFTQTQQAESTEGFDPGGGVYGIEATQGQIYWLSAYNGASFIPYVQVECGGGGTATQCEPNVDEPTTMIVDPANTFWVGGMTFDGNGEIATPQGSSQFADQIEQLVVGPGNAVWGILQNYPGYAIARFSDSGGTVTIAQTFALPSGDAAGSLTFGSDGALWFTDQQRNAIGRMDTSGRFTEYPIPTPNALGQPWFGLWQIATACDGFMWFSEPSANKIGRIDPHGDIREFSMPTANALPDAVTAPAGASASHCASPKIWVGEQNASKLAAVSY